jgi:signal transduction histidine kinase
MPFSGRRSLAVKLPLLSSLMLLLAVGAMTIASYLELRSALVEIATTRLQQAAERTADVFSMSARQRLAAMQALMGRPDVRAFLLTRDAAARPALEAALTSYLGTAATFADVELWDGDGKRLLAVGATSDEVSGTMLDDYKKDLSRVDVASIGRLRMFADGLRYPVGGPLSADGSAIGYVVERRVISNPSQARQTVQLLTGLIGNEATMLVGNADGSLWSNLESPVRDVPITLGQDRLWDYKRTGMRRAFAWATPIASTPWVTAIEFPRDVVLAPSQRFLLRSLAIAACLLILATAAIWGISRRMTLPLVRVTEAAEALAESRTAVHVDIHRTDEIGRLAESFNAMAEKVDLARQELESRVEQRTAELSAANRELEAFSYSVSHDLRAPLRAIAGFVQILEEDHGASLDPQARHHLERVSVNAHRMGQLIDDLLSFSRIGRSTMARQTFDMTTMATSVANEVVAASGRQIDVTIDPLPHCYGEPGLLNQVFVNLISNAVKFTSPVAKASIHVGTKIENGETVYFVRDNGVGFDSRYADKLFGVFQRLHRRNEFEGTGVGLAIVQRIIHRHGGRVWAEGNINEGATFFFTLPVCETAPENQAG